MKGHVTHQTPLVCWVPSSAARLDRYGYNVGQIEKGEDSGKPIQDSVQEEALEGVLMKHVGKDVSLAEFELGNFNRKSSIIVELLRV